MIIIRVVWSITTPPTPVSSYSFHTSGCLGQDDFVYNSEESMTVNQNREESTTVNQNQME